MINTEEKKGVADGKARLPAKETDKDGLSPLRVLKLLFTSIFTLSLISLTASFFKYVTSPLPGNQVNILMTFFYFDKEYNLPTYFSSIILFTAAALLGYIFHLKSGRKDSYSRYWAVLSLGFLFMSIDEYVGFHEILNISLQENTNLSTSLSGWLYFPWVIAGTGVVIAVGLLFYRFLLHLNPQSRKQFLLAGLLYVGGGIGFELVGGYLTANYGGRETFFYSLVSHTEEILEMAGVSYFIYALLLYITVHEKKKGVLPN